MSAWIPGPLCLFAAWTTSTLADQAGAEACAPRRRGMAQGACLQALDRMLAEQRAINAVRLATS